MSSLQSPVQVNISSLTILKVVLVGLGLFFLWAIRDIIAMVFVAWVLSSALDPWVTRLHRKRIPRGVAILSVYLVVIAVVVLLFTLLVPSLSRELSSLGNNFPSYYEPLRQNLFNLQSIGIPASIQHSIDAAVGNLTAMTSGIYGAVASVFGGIAAVFAVLVIAFYMTVEEDGIKKFIQSILPVNYQPYIIQKLNKIQQRLSAWLWGQIILMLFVGILSGLAMWILGVKYWLVLGLLAGLTEFIPLIGPVIAAIPSTFFAFTDFATAPYKPFLVIIIFILIQQIENQILVPKIMNKATGLNPIVVIISLLVGGKVAGLAGVILAVPFVTIVGIFLEDFFEQRKQEQNKLE
jgi:predicted PurR-regulated permease PerM